VETGIYSNSDAAPMPEGCTIFERAQRAFGKESLATVVITGKMSFGDPEPDVLPRSILSTAGAGITIYDASNRDANEVGDLALEALVTVKAGRFLAFFHFMDPDYAAHGTGSGGEDYRQAVAQCDQALGRIVGLLKREELYDSTRIYVTADHGFDPDAMTHNNAPFVWLATNDKAVVCGGTQADVPATILARMGVDLATLRPALLGQPLTKAPASVAR